MHYPDLSAIKAIALDMDGTALNPQGEVTPALKEALTKVDALGIKIIIATGRSPNMLTNLFKDFPEDSPYILSVGSHIYNVKGFEYLKSIPPHIVERVVDYGLTYPNFKVYANSAEGCYGSIIDNWVYCPEGEPSIQNAVKRQVKLCKIFFQDLEGKHERVAQIKQWLEENFSDDLEAYFSSTFTLDIVAKGVSKITALQDLLSFYGLEAKKHLIAFGDSLNDAMMLYGSRYGFYMANTAPQFQEQFAQADNLFPIGSNRADGLARALNQFFNLGIEESLFATGKENYSPDDNSNNVLNSD